MNFKEFDEKILTPLLDSKGDKACCFNDSVKVFSLGEVRYIALQAFYAAPVAPQPSIEADGERS